MKLLTPNHLVCHLYVTGLKMARTVGNAPTFDGFGDHCITCLPRPYNKLIFGNLHPVNETL